MTADEENKLIAERNRGAAADVELRITREGFETLRAGYIKAWQESDPRDTAGREKIWVAMTMLAQVEKHLRTVVDNGKLADAELERLRRHGEPKKKRLGII